MSSIHESVYLAEGSRVIDNVTIGEDSAVWYNAVIRGDETPIRIGKRTNIQDNAVLHGDEGHPVTIGDGVTIGHGAIVHGCTVGNNVLIGMGAIILNDAVIGDDCIIGAGALVTQRMQIPAGSIVYGNPAKVAKAASEEAVEGIRENAEIYVQLARKAKETGVRSVSPDLKCR